ncbi:hypothetical protein QYM36_008778 [Artemia franciscana]|uniref:Uncharacterized protein n=2 Tax=Artemia franciscana TaxID=6661 RepID=A0AA88HUV3_ARTSF|nr:hypothetical protein QYM36_008778 [Artemia franciscana]
MEEDTQPSIISSTLTQELKIKDGHTSMNEVNTIDDSCIKDENMVALGELGVKVFDQISLETGIAEQIESAIEAEEERIRKKKEFQEGKKKAIKKVTKKKTSADDGNEDSEVEKEEIAVANSADVLEDFSEVDEKIKLGEMTPFGTVLESSKM